MNKNYYRNPRQERIFIPMLHQSLMPYDEFIKMQKKRDRNGNVDLKQIERYYEKYKKDWEEE